MCLRIAVFFAFVTLLFAGTANARQFAYRVNFTDKNSTTFRLDSPLSYLSARAVLRRTTQSITIDSTDIPVNKWYIDSVLVLTGGKLHEASRWLNMCIILISDSTLIHALDTISFVTGYSFEAYYSGILHKTTPKKVEKLTNVNNAERVTSGDAAYYNLTWAQTNMVNGNYLHDLGYKGAGKIIAVFDAGFSYTDTHIGFDSLRASGRIIDEHNFVLDTSYIYAYDPHGTEVLSTMAGYVPNTFVGSAPLAMYALYISEDDNTEQPIEMINMLCAAERADSIGADIITESLGYDLFDNPTFGLNYSTDLDGKTTVAAIAANKATQKGLLWVATAGNDGTGYLTWGNHILTPGDADSALTIGSVEPTGIIAASSGYGPNAAGQLKPDVCTQGQPATVFSTTDYNSADGTSFSTPQIAGWAACLWEGCPNAKPYQLKQAIRQCANKFTTPDNQYGYGIPNFQCVSQLLSVKDTPNPEQINNWITTLQNPFTVTLNLSIVAGVSENIHFEIMDAIGKSVVSMDNYFVTGYYLPFSINTSYFPSGIYFLKATSSKQQKVIKLLKL